MPGVVFEPGQFVAERYRVVSLLGSGGMGAVYLAHHELLQQDVAVKVLTSAPDDVARERFLREARAAAKLRSRHVVRVMDVGVLPAGELFIVMERLRGLDLEQRLERDGPLPVTEAVDDMLEALDVLAEAHAAGIVHRDLKPANLFLSEEDGTTVVKVLDFGISKTGADETLSLTATSSVMGSPFYMSPEQARSSRSVDQRADIWSLGVVLYELLSGVSPFAAETIGGVFGKIYEENPVPLSQVRADVPPGLAEVVARCLAKQADDRYRDCGELATALATFGSGTRHACVTRAVSFARPSGGNITVVAPSSPGSNPRLPVASAAKNEATQTRDGWGRESGRDASPARTSPALWMLAGIAATTLLIGLGLIIYSVNARRHADPVVVTAVPSAPPPPSSPALSAEPAAVVSASASPPPKPSASTAAVVTAVPKPVPRPTSTTKTITDTSKTRD